MLDTSPPSLAIESRAYSKRTALDRFILPRLSFHVSTS